MRQFYLIQALIGMCAAVALGILNFEDKLKWLNVCRYILYIITIQAIPHIYKLAHNYSSSETIPNLKRSIKEAANYILIYTACVCLLVYHRQSLYVEEFVCLFLAFLVYKYPEMEIRTLRQEMNDIRRNFGSFREEVRTEIEESKTMYQDLNEKTEHFAECIENHKDRLSNIETTCKDLPALMLQIQNLTSKLHNKDRMALRNDIETAKESISYGVGMACSYFEGYLVHVLPSDGAAFYGFESNIQALEDREGVLFPVKKLFIIITKSLYCPPDLKEFNKKGKDAPYLEAFNSLEDVTKNVAGVRNRSYRNTAYKIYRAGAPPVPLCAECATPLHTLHRALARTALAQQLSNIDTARVVEDFCSTLNSIIERSPEMRGPDKLGKCHLVYYDHEDPTQNLAEILLQTIKQFEPDFEQKIIDRKNDNIVHE